MSTYSLASVLAPGGMMSRIVSGYEHREQQIEMLQNVEEALAQNSIALIEAGTGIGKSMAYLLPALFWAVQKKERILISTHTITLQEQLLNKDIPLAKQALGATLKVVLVKGMSNYLCMRKLQDSTFEKKTFSSKEFEEQEKIEAWAETTHDGTRAALSFEPSSSTWDRVSAENDTCSFGKCPFYNQCFFFKARKEAESAQVLIVNHSLLFADLAFQKEGKEGILPPYQKVIIDEAHRIEDVATDFFSTRISYLSLLKLLNRLSAEKQGKIAHLKDKLALHFSKFTPDGVRLLLSRLNLDLPALRRDFQQRLSESFRLFDLFLQQGFPEGEGKLRLLPKHYTSSFWEKELSPSLLQTIESGKRFLQSLSQLIAEVGRLKDEKLEGKIEGIRTDILGLSRRLEDALSNMKQFMEKNCPEEKVRWVESQPLKHLVNIHLIEASLDISELMAKYLFNPTPTTVLTSATLATGTSFSFFRQRVGLTEKLLEKKEVLEKRYLSPFDYETQAKLVVAIDMPHPNDPSFLPAAIENVWEAIQASWGNAFVLFTSHGMMRECARALKERLEQRRFPLFLQGDASRHNLLEKFRETDYSVLFGTDSFWEGVDVAGDALRCVILVKLPFKVPTEPIIQARNEAIQRRGGDPFNEYQLPMAIVKFKQGFGRLIRNKKDRGCIVCLDSRLISKNYGSLFLKSLPSCQHAAVPSSQLHQVMRGFYRKSPTEST